MLKIIEHDSTKIQHNFFKHLNILFHVIKQEGPEVKKKKKKEAFKWECMITGKHILIS